MVVSHRTLLPPSCVPEADVARQVTVETGTVAATLVGIPRRWGPVSTPAAGSTETEQLVFTIAE
jgi:hypothetical protein